MELTFNPEEEFERIIGRSVSDYERNELNRFLTDYLLQSKKADNESLGITIESALESDFQDEFTKRDFENSVQEYKNTHKIISKKLISEVREACDRYHAKKSDTKIEEVLRNENFLKEKNIKKLYSRKNSEKYTFLFLDDYNNTFVKNKTKFVSLPPEEGIKFEDLLKKHNELYDFGICGLFGLASGIATTIFYGTGVEDANIIVGAGIIFASCLTSLSLGYGIELMINRHKEKGLTKKIENYFSEEAHYPMLVSSKPYDPEIILNALAE